MNGDRQSAGTQWILVLLAVLLVFVVVATVAVNWPLLLWSTLHGDPVLMAPGAAAGGAFSLVQSKPARAWAGYDMPPLEFAIVALGLLFGGLVLLYVAVVLRVDRWRGQSHADARSYSLKRKVTARAFAKPRDWLHLQPVEGSRSGLVRRAVNRVLRPLVGERRVPDRIDTWNLGRLRGAEVAAAPEQHMVVFGPSRSGKTMHELLVQVRAHRGPLVVMSNKLDVVVHSLMLRSMLGPVWVYAPFNQLRRLRVACAKWTPLTVCRSWSGALAMAKWLYDADPTASAASDSSGGARFYNREAIEALLPALLHAAALDGRSMTDVLYWLRAGVDGLDEPRRVLMDHEDAERAALALAGVQALDERPRSLLLMSAAQLVAAYRHPQVQIHDARDFDPERLLDENGTIYMVAPDGYQEEMAPLFAGIFGELLRVCEDRAQHVADPRELPLLKVLIDEAANLAPLRRLPAILSVCGGWSVRVMVVYQSVAQVRQRYGTDADTLLANLLVKKVLGPVHDHQTREEFVRLLGEHDVEEKAVSTDRWGANTTETWRTEQRPKITSVDLQRLPEGTAIVVHGRDLPARVKLSAYWEWEGARDHTELLARDARRTRGPQP